MPKLENFLDSLVDLFEISANIKGLLLEASNRSQASIDWIFKKISHLQENEYSTYVFLGLLWTLFAIFLMTVLYWKYIKIQDTSLSLKKYTYEVHRTAGSLNPSTESMKSCIYILNQFPSLINQPTPPYHYTPFLRACWSGNTALVRYMLLNGADINSCTVSIETPVYLAAYRTVKSKTWNPSVLELLYKAGCPLSAPTAKGLTALHYAASAGHVSLTRWLLMHGAHLSLPHSRMTPYDMAIRIRDQNHQSVAALLHLYCPKMAERKLIKLSQQQQPTTLLQA